MDPRWTCGQQGEWSSLSRCSRGTVADRCSCIMLELFVTKPVFQGNDEIHQLEVIYSVMGTPRESHWPSVKELPWYELVKPKQEIPSKFGETFSK
jgi:hypothetical protein